ncbi:MAG: hypothetical protein GY702_29480 [Desulfobulbaceae bacterium]|nr:hypothetical protein [Desulfobulbaceae bacterium]
MCGKPRKSYESECHITFQSRVKNPVRHLDYLT